MFDIAARSLKAENSYKRPHPNSRTQRDDNRNVKQLSWIALQQQEARVALGCASCNSYASFVLSKLSACSISRRTHADA